MSDIFFLVLRRLRTPLILLICVYAIATLGMTLIPGVDDQGRPWHMSFFHAFYFVSFMGSTIGFGEIPYAFTDGQRAWVLVCIYTSVVAWLYAIGTMISLLQDPTFKNAISNRAFERNIKRISEAFYIICGFGETGALINNGLAKLGIRTVIIDYNIENTSSLELQDSLQAPIVLTADSSNPQNLLAAGLDHPMCRGLIAVTENDHTNLQIALSCKLLNKHIPVICRSEIRDEADNMASFGTDAIINPYDTFARRLNLFAHKPALHKIQNWFINQQNKAHISERMPPKGKWIICSYGRFGKAIHQYLDLDQQDIELIFVDNEPQQNKAPEGTIIGRGTEAETLKEADIKNASAIVAASDDDANNLSILMTAKQLNPEIYCIGRASQQTNEALFVKAHCDYLLRRSHVIANEVLTLISRPLVTRFIQYSNRLENQQIDDLIGEIEQLTNQKAPVTWRLKVDKKHAPAMVQHLDKEHTITLQHLSQHQLFPKARVIPLLIQRQGVHHLIPEIDMPIEIGDQILFCGKQGHTFLPQMLTNNIELIDTIVNNNPHHIPLLRWLKRFS